MLRELARRQRHTPVSSAGFNPGFPRGATPVTSTGATPVEHPKGTRFNRAGGAGREHGDVFHISFR